MYKNHVPRHKRKKWVWKSLTVVTIMVFLSLPVFDATTTLETADQEHASPSTYVNRCIPPCDNDCLDNSGKMLDGWFIYNITAALSNIIFTVYDTKQGEIPKGRAFGTKGEHHAAEIIAENMTKLGLHTTIEKLEKRPFHPADDIAHKLEVLEYQVKINGNPVDCFPAPSWKLFSESSDELNVTFNYSNLKIKRMPDHPCVYSRQLASETEDFVFITQDQWNDPNGSLPVIDLAKPFLDPLKFYMLFHITSLLNIQKETAFWSVVYPHCKGLILYDFNEECHDMIYFGGPYKNFLPTIFINGSLGKKIWENTDAYHLDLYLKQRYNTSVISYNVIGQLNGTDPSKTVIVSSLYDCWWCQGTADSAIGIGIILAIAKYFRENNITPKYTMKFIAFCGEEYDIRGAIYHEAVHRDENIIYVIDLNQLGFTQKEPRLTLDIVANKPFFLKELWAIAEKTNFVQRTGNATGMRKILWINGRIPSNSYPFGVHRKNCCTVSFFKNGGWILHHRDGRNHTEGDVLKYYNWTEVNITGELILNITKYFTVENGDEKYPGNQFFPLLEKTQLFRSHKIKNQARKNTQSNFTELMKTGPMNAIYSSFGTSEVSPSFLSKSPFCLMAT